jgi:hypothetical protein
VDDGIDFAGTGDGGVEVDHGEPCR